MNIKQKIMVARKVYGFIIQNKSEDHILVLFS